MSDIDYWEDMHYQEFLLSRRRRDLCPPQKVMDQLNFHDAFNVVDFGMGLGFFVPFLRAKLPSDCWLWGAESQPDIIDLVLKKKVNESIEKFSVFFMEKTEHPLLPQWVPVPEVIFAAMSLSTFADPGLAMDGLIRSMRQGGRLLIIDWAKVDFPEGPPVKDKISLDKMTYLAEFYKLKVVQSFMINEYVYYLEVIAGKEFLFGFYDFRE
jgi:SAM-dependent methyltransferase